LEDAVHVASEVAEGLDYAHSKGVVHRDVKPANILITEDRQVKLTDFGIARLDTSNLTLEGQLLGTPNYMAPEQIQGQATDHRADVFSLGVVLYEMLTGEKPFKGENVTVVTHRIVYDEYTPPEEYVGHLQRRSWRCSTERLAKDPDERFSERAARWAEALQERRRPRSAAESLNETQVIFDPDAADRAPSRRRGARRRGGDLPGSGGPERGRRHPAGRRLAATGLDLGGPGHASSSAAQRPRALRPPIWHP
jgi:eukaryotic-like serine/threonine-protein kinase